MKLYRIYAIFLRHLYQIRRSLEKLSTAIYWPLIDLSTWGFSSVYFSQFDKTQVLVMLGCVLLWSTVIMVQNEFTYSFLEEIWARNLVNLYVTPLKVLEHVFGVLLVCMFRLPLVMFAGALYAWLLFGANVLVSWWVMLIYLGGFLFAISIGLLFSSIIFVLGTRVQTIAWTLIWLVVPFSGVYFPLSLFPESVRPILLVNPLANLFTVLRELLATGGFEGGMLVYGVVGALVMVLFMMVVYFKTFEMLLVRRGVVKIS